MSVISNYVEPKAVEPTNPRYSKIQLELLETAQFRMLKRSNAFTALPSFNVRSDLILRSMLADAVNADSRTLFVMRGAIASLAGSALWESRRALSQRNRKMAVTSFSEQERAILARAFPQALSVEISALNAASSEEVESETADLLDTCQDVWQVLLRIEVALASRKEEKAAWRTLLGEEPKKVNIPDGEREMLIPVFVGSQWAELPRSVAIEWFDANLAKESLQTSADTEVSRQRNLAAEYAKIV